MTMPRETVDALLLYDRMRQLIESEVDQSSDWEMCVRIAATFFFHDDAASLTAWMHDRDARRSEALRQRCAA